MGKRAEARQSSSEGSSRPWVTIFRPSAEMTATVNVADRQVLLPVGQEAAATGCFANLSHP